MTARFAFATAPPRPGLGAIALIDLSADTAEHLDRALHTLNSPHVASGDAALRTLARIDPAVVARVTPTHAQLMPHAGPAILDALHTALREHRLKPAPDDPNARYPEARDRPEACALDAIASAASPSAIDLIAAHADRHRNDVQPVKAEHQTQLDRLLSPPIVVAVGPPNIGKSSLLNALARDRLAVVADIPGTTRDHLGVQLLLDQLAVRWLDTPGLTLDEQHPTADMLDRIAQKRALAAVRSADLIVRCIDAAHPAPGLALPLPEQVPNLTAFLRADLAPQAPAVHSGITTSARTGQGLDALAEAVRRALVSDAAIADPGRWRFHPGL